MDLPFAASISCMFQADKTHSRVISLLYVCYRLYFDKVDAISALLKHNYKRLLPHIGNRFVINSIDHAT